jgi:hypothetical protein
MDELRNFALANLYEKIIGLMPNSLNGFNISSFFILTENAEAE